MQSFQGLIPSFSTTESTAPRAKEQEQKEALTKQQSKAEAQESCRKQLFQISGKSMSCTACRSFACIRDLTRPRGLRQAAISQEAHTNQRLEPESHFQEKKNEQYSPEKRHNPVSGTRSRADHSSCHTWTRMSLHRSGTVSGNSSPKHNMTLLSGKRPWLL